MKKKDKTVQESVKLDLSNSTDDSTLFLSLKARWYEMIESGVKLEEYREIKPYYTNRFLRVGLLENKNAWIIFRNGYSKKSPKFSALCSLDVGEGKAEWGAIPEKKYYKLKIIQIIKE